MKFTKDYIFISRSLHKKLGDKFVAIRKEAERIHMEFLFLEKDDLREIEKILELENYEISLITAIITSEKDKFDRINEFPVVLIIARKKKGEHHDG